MGERPFLLQEEKGPAGNQEVLEEATSPLGSPDALSLSASSWAWGTRAPTPLPSAGTSPPGCRRLGCPWLLSLRSTDTASSSAARRDPV